MDAIKPSPAVKGKKIDLSAEEASMRVKVCGRNIGADLVGITKLNPLWVYANKGRLLNLGLRWLDEKREKPLGSLPGILTNPCGPLKSWIFML